MARSYTQEERVEALRAYEEYGTSKAARLLGIPRGTINTWAHKAGARTERSENTRAAVEAKKTDNALRRANIASRLLDIAEGLAAELDDSVVVYAFGGRYNDFNEAKASKPQPRDKQAILTSIAIALDKSMALERFDAEGGQGLAAVDEWLRTVLSK